MPQILRSTSAPRYVGAWTPSNIAALRSKIKAGAPITAADIKLLSSIVSSCYNHKHDVYDYAYEAYGNKPAMSTHGVWAITSEVMPPPKPAPNIIYEISAFELNKLIISVAVLKTHFHWKEDTWY